MSLTIGSAEILPGDTMPAKKLPKIPFPPAMYVRMASEYRAISTCAWPTARNINTNADARERKLFQPSFNPTTIEETPPVLIFAQKRAIVMSAKGRTFNTIFNIISPPNLCFGTYGDSILTFLSLCQYKQKPD